MNIPIYMAQTKYHDLHMPHALARNFVLRYRRARTRCMIQHPRHCGKRRRRSSFDDGFATACAQSILRDKRSSRLWSDFGAAKFTHAGPSELRKRQRGDQIRIVYKARSITYLRDDLISLAEDAKFICRHLVPKSDPSPLWKYSSLIVR